MEDCGPPREESRNSLRVGGLLTSHGEVTDYRGKEYVVPLPSLSAPSGRSLGSNQKHAIYVGMFISLYGHRAFIFMHSLRGKFASKSFANLAQRICVMLL